MYLEYLHQTLQYLLMVCCGKLFELEKYYRHIEGILQWGASSQDGYYRMFCLHSNICIYLSRVVEPETEKGKEKDFLSLLDFVSRANAVARASVIRLSVHP